MWPDPLEDAEEAARAFYIVLTIVLVCIAVLGW